MKKYNIKKVRKVEKMEKIRGIDRVIENKKDERGERGYWRKKYNQMAEENSGFEASIYYHIIYG